MSSDPFPRHVPEDKTTRFTWLQGLINLRVLENETLDYKSGDSLNKLSADYLKNVPVEVPEGSKKKSRTTIIDETKDELCKDVSAFANAAGGLLIYGIAEKKDAEKGQSYPTAFDPVTKNLITHEQLADILKSISPPVEGLRIHDVEMPDEERYRGKYCVVIEIPESTTAHQAPDRKYHRRRYNITEAMPGHEIQEVMNRAKNPDLSCKISISFSPPSDPSKNPYTNTLLVRVFNNSKVFCKNFCCRVYFPTAMHGMIVNPGSMASAGLTAKPLFVERTPEGIGTRLDFLGTDLFPGFDQRFDYKFGFATPPLSQISNDPTILKDKMWVEIFADNMPKKPFWLSVNDALQEAENLKNHLFPELMVLGLTSSSI